MRLCGCLLAIARWSHGRCFGVWHRGRDTALLFRSELEDVVRQKLAVISFETVKRRRCRARENPLVVLLSEQARWHGCARTNGLGIGDPALDPIRLQAFLREQEVWRCSDLVVRGIARRVALQTRRRR